jgi:hypothetical protein
VLVSDIVGLNILEGTLLTFVFSLFVHKVCRAEMVVVVDQVLGFMVACTDKGEGQLVFMDMEVVCKLAFISFFFIY